MDRVLRFPKTDWRLSHDDLGQQDNRQAPRDRNARPGRSVGRFETASRGIGAASEPPLTIPTLSIGCI